ncbi:MAG: hypothetical protein K8J08_00430 [Thermoanaerobaculia bacterium]|nr:hypothetical protein [Thermoanaerobaculia bacterium]
MFTFKTITFKTIRRSVHPAASLLSFTLLFGVASAMPATAVVTGQESTQHEHQDAMKPDQGEAMQSDGMANCKAMMADREQMMQASQAGDEKLEELLGSIRSASGDAKVDAIQATLEELIAQRRASATMMMKHHPSMMEGHASMMGGMPHPSEDGMAMCPMMKKMVSEDEMMSDGKETPPEAEEDVGEGEHSAHHQ